LYLAIFMSVYKKRSVLPSALEICWAKIVALSNVIQIVKCHGTKKNVTLFTNSCCELHLN